MSREPAPPGGVNSPPIFTDGFGARWVTFDAETGDPVEILSFNAPLVEAEDFGPALGVRVARLAGARHTSYARVRRLDRPSPDALLLVSDRVAGWRFARILEIVEQEKSPVDIGAIISLLRQLIPAVTLFARHQRDFAVGAIGPERLVLTPQGRIVLSEYVLGPAIEKLRYTQDQLWRDFRVAVPTAEGAVRITPRSDVLGIAVFALSLLLGRRIREQEFPDGLADLVRLATESSGGTVRSVSDALTKWLDRALQVDENTAFQTPQEAQVAFEEVLASERSYVTAPGLLDAFVARVAAVAGRPPEPAKPKAAPDVTYPEPELEIPALPTPVAAMEFNMDPIDLDAELDAASKRSTPAVAQPVTAPREQAIAPAIDEPPVASYGESATSAPSYPEPAYPGPSYSQPSYTDPAPPASFEQSAAVATPAVTAPPFGRPATEAPPIAKQDSIDVTAPAPSAPAEGKRWMTGVLAGLALLAVIEAVAVVLLWNRPGDTLTSDGELIVQSRPSAARVVIDRKERGTTPLTVKLSPGAHILEVQVGSSEPRVIPLQIRAGVQTAQYVELQSVPTTGILEISSEPSRARVTVDGQDRGTTPVVVKDLPPGDHEVVVKAGEREFKQTVRVEAGKTGQMLARLLP